MKKNLLAILCVISFGLSACDKKPTDNSTTSSAVTVKQSTNIPADIKDDLAKIEVLSVKKASEAIDFQSKVTEALSKNDKAALEQVFKDMQAYVEDFNQGLDALDIKSTEAEAIRKLMKEGNILGVDLAQEGMSSKPNIDKINELTKKATEIQKELLSQMMAMKQKADDVK